VHQQRRKLLQDPVLPFPCDLCNDCAVERFRIPLPSGRVFITFAGFCADSLGKFAQPPESSLDRDEDVFASFLLGVPNDNRYSKCFTIALEERVFPIQAKQFPGVP